MQTLTGGGSGRKLEQTQKRQTGVCVFLQTVMESLDRHAKLLGLYAPTATTSTVLTTLPAEHVDQLLREHYASTLKPARTAAMR